MSVVCAFCYPAATVDHDDPRRRTGFSSRRLRASEPITSRPDRFAMWAVVMAVVAMLVAAVSSAHAAQGDVGPADSGGRGEHRGVDLVLGQAGGVGDQALELVQGHLAERLEQLLVGPVGLAGLLEQVERAGARRRPWRP